MNSNEHHIISYHITSYHITSHHITSHHITSHHTTSHHITSHHITSHHILTTRRYLSTLLIISYLQYISLLISSSLLLLTYVHYLSYHCEYTSYESTYHITSHHIFRTYLFLLLINSYPSMAAVKPTTL
jgi:hypothetical protein